MGVPAQSLPTIGQPNSTEDPKIRSALLELQQILDRTQTGLGGDNLSTALAGHLGASDSAATRRGKSIIAPEESRTNTVFGPMPTPDRVSGIVLPTDGLICVAFMGFWKESVKGEGAAAIFVGNTQLRYAWNVRDGEQEAVHGFSTSDASHATPNTWHNLGTDPRGLVSESFDGGGGSAAIGTHATTGQVVAHEFTSANGYSSDTGFFGGPCYIFASAGTYDISVQFRSGAGSVSAKNRKLWVWTMGF